MTVYEMEEELKKLIWEEFPKLYDFAPLSDVQLLKYSENITFKLTFRERADEDISESDDMAPVVFRVHRPGYHSREELISEMRWMEEIASDTDVCLPKVFHGKDGKELQQLSAPDGRKWNCSVVSFLEGRLMGEISGEELSDAIRQIGGITARLHLQAIGRNKEIKLDRPSWDIHNFFDRDGIWGSWRDYPGLTEEQENVLSECQRKITKRLDEYGRSDRHYGIIHGDLHFNNIICRNGVSQIFDFDDCGYGFYLYDLGCTLVTCSEDLENLTGKWLEGYEEYRTLSMEEKGMLPMFILLRRIVRLAWLASHQDSDTWNEVEEGYLNITIHMAEKLLAESGGSI